MTEHGLQRQHGAEIVGITYRQLDYWARTDLIRPSLADATGSGSRRLYSYRDLLELRVIKSLLDAGIKLESVRQAFTYLREHMGTDIAAAHLVISGSDVMLCDGDELIDVMNRAGQGVLNVLPLGGVKSSLDRQHRRARRDGRRRDARADAAAPPRRVMRRRPTFEHCPLDAVHRALGAQMVPFGGWEMPLAYAAGTIAEHLACRRDAVVFDVTHLGTVRVEGADADERLQRALTNDLGKIGPGRAQYTHLLDEVDASVLDDIIVWWVDDEVFDVMPNASNTDRVRAAIGGTETTRDARRPRRAGPAAPRSAWRRCSPRRPPSAGSASPRLDWEGVAVHGRRHRLHRRGRRRDRRAGRRRPPTCGRRSPAAGVEPAGLGARDTLRLEAGAAAARPRARPGHHAAAGRARLGRRVGQGRVPRPRARSAAERDARRRPAAARHRHRRPPPAACRVRGAASTARSVGALTSGNFSPVLGHGIALGFLPPAIERGHRRSPSTCAARRSPGSVVATPVRRQALSRSGASRAGTRSRCRSGGRRDRPVSAAWRACAWPASWSPASSPWRACASPRPSSPARLAARSAALPAPAPGSGRRGRLGRRRGRRRRRGVAATGRRQERGERAAAEHPAGRLGHLTERLQAPAEVAQRAEEVVEILGQRVQRRASSSASARRASPGATLSIGCVQPLDQVVGRLDACG